ncbi:FBP domain-containing protein [Clostridium paridis]|uniref:FBP domain-containing protein n=1 Tax=Clostridium paridis TaxID=2803863 RepID=A0A937FE28_9CLOT|nr:FBP domain-containing protein [Clostridium paridis]MBL4930587.1 FBP domain-containing protein [Clostridium paridis]
MNTFIKKHEFNYIRKLLLDLKNAFIGCVDKDIIEASKANTQDKILNIFQDLSEEEKGILDISKLTKIHHFDSYIEELNEYVYGIPNITNAQLSRLFKKEKKFKLPTQEDQASKNVYLGWIDNSIRKLFVAYNMNGNLIGMACRISNPDANNSHRCVLCNRVGKENEVAFVSPICKTTSTAEGAYRSIGFDLCLDSKECNERIVSTEKLEEILKNVNNIK